MVFFDIHTISYARNENDVCSLNSLPLQSSTFIFHFIYINTFSSFIFMRLIFSLLIGIHS